LICTTPTAQAAIESMFGHLSAGQPHFTAPATTLIPLGISVDDPGGSRQQSRAHLSIDPEAFVVLCLGRFSLQSKMDLLPVLQLASRTAGKLKRPLLFILAGASGDGGYAAFIREQIRFQNLSPLVRLDLDPDDTRKAHLLCAADVFLSLSDNIQETFGIAPIEAMAMGLPVVVSDWDGYRHVVEDGVSGLLVPTRSLAPDASWDAMLALRDMNLIHMFMGQTTAVDLDVACEHLVRLAGNPALWGRLSEGARRRARSFEWKNVIAQYIRLWQEMRASRAVAGKNDVQLPVQSSAPCPSAFFAGYPTAHLRAEDRFRATARGKALLDGQGPNFFYNATDEFLDLSLMTAIVAPCLEGSSVGQLTATLDAPGGALQIHQNILWLYKQGYLGTA